MTVTGLSVSYGDLVALRDVSFHAPAGSLLAVTGASGAGKTSLLWAMAGLVAPRAGTVARSPEAATVALIPQGNGLAMVLTARENLLVALLAAGVGRRDAAARADAALERLGVDGQSGQLVDELSGGQRQRVAIARGLAMTADVLLADEITSDLDPRNRDVAMEVLREEARRGAAVVFATHDPRAAADCDGELRLVDGAAVSATRPA
ncbi:ABC transporter ATP-binding protein [Stackebrandtia albiflava]|nr:ATP-binding cassette domain-containing protein [Stackebrandtia albiflava]